MGKLTRLIVPLIKFIVGAVIIGGVVYAWRIGRLSGWREAEPVDSGTGAPPGKLFGVVQDAPGFGAYEVGIGAGAMTIVALTAFALKKMGLKKYSPDATNLPGTKIG